jgi:O-antigen ligase
VQNRIADLRTEMTNAKGGRLVMWTRIAPELHREYPGGIGFRCLTEEMMQNTATHIGVIVEPNRNHLHNNFVQVTVAMGYAGLLLYLLWMAQGIFDGTCWYRREPRKSHSRGVALCALLMLILLLLNGLVEYNLADSELVLLYGMLLGMLATNAKTQSTNG